jgi:hypothetical protein
MTILELCELSISVVKMECELDHDGINHGVSEDAEGLKRKAQSQSGTLRTPYLCG